MFTYNKYPTLAPLGISTLEHLVIIIIITHEARSEQPKAASGAKRSEQTKSANVAKRSESVVKNFFS